MKPLLRWTIGKTTNIGLKCLKYSIKKAKYHFQDDFNYILCYNDIDFYKIKSINIEKLNQNEIQKKIDVKNGAWKLIPDRLNVNGYEMWIDNDVILENNPIFLKKIIAENKYFICEGLHGLYGNYRNKIPSDKKMCSCFFGMPPNNFIKQELHENKFLDHFDEQGLISYICCQNNSEKIKLTEIQNCEKQFIHSEIGYHFVGINRCDQHMPWDSFLKNKIKNL